MVVSNIITPNYFLRNFVRIKELVKNGRLNEMDISINDLLWLKEFCVKYCNNYAVREQISNKLERKIYSNKGLNLDCHKVLKKLAELGL